jgi:hypothetical protein
VLAWTRLRGGQGLVQIGTRLAWEKGWGLAHFLVRHPPRSTTWCHRGCTVARHTGDQRRSFGLPGLCVCGHVADHGLDTGVPMRGALVLQDHGSATACQAKASSKTHRKTTVGKRKAWPVLRRTTLAREGVGTRPTTQRWKAVCERNVCVEDT